MHQDGRLALEKLLAGGEQELLVADQGGDRGVRHARVQLGRQLQRGLAHRFRREPGVLAQEGVVLILKHRNGGAGLDVVEDQKRLAGAHMLAFLHQDRLHDPDFPGAQRLALRVGPHLGLGGDARGELADRGPQTQAEDQRTDDARAHDHRSAQPLLQLGGHRLLLVVPESRGDVVAADRGEIQFHRPASTARTSGAAPV